MWPVRRWRVPNTVRRALYPEIGTVAACPRRAQAARKGGKSNKSVSSSARSAVGAGRAWIWRKSERFFLLLRVGGQHVAEALPDITQVFQTPPQRGARSRLRGETNLQEGSEQRYGPTVGGGIAQLERRLRHGRVHQTGQVLVPLGRAPLTPAVRQRHDPAVRGKPLQPTMHAA